MFYSFLVNFTYLSKFKFKRIFFELFKALFIMDVRFLNNKLIYEGYDGLKTIDVYFNFLR